MTNTSKTLVYFGTDEYSLIALRKLVEAGYELAAIVSKPDRPVGRGRKMQSPVVAKFAKEQHIRLFQPEKLSAIHDELAALQPDIGIVVFYGKLIPNEILNTFPDGILNIHPSLLPKYRGPAPVLNPILNGDSETGVSLIKLDAEMDAGPMYAQTKHPLDGTEFRNDLHKQLAHEGAELLLDSLPSIVDGSLQPIEQDHSQATTTHIIHKQDGQIDWLKSAEQIEREVRGYIGWPGSFTNLLDTNMIITNASVFNQSGTPGNHFVYQNRLAVYCDEHALLIYTLRPANKPEMPSEAFLRGRNS